jgi:pimeloyl-ACP methyl ester carboxylesterase
VAHGPARPCLFGFHSAVASLCYCCLLLLLLRDAATRCRCCQGVNCLLTKTKWPFIILTFSSFRSSGARGSFHYIYIYIKYISCSFHQTKQQHRKNNNAIHFNCLIPHTLTTTTNETMDCSKSTNAASEPPLSFPALSDEILQLPDGRNLAYRICGATKKDTTTSRTTEQQRHRQQLVFAFHGALGTGNFDRWSPLFDKELGWLVVAPTLPGWGQSSPYNAGYTLQQYAEYDMQHLIRHVVETLQLLAPDDDDLDDGNNVSTSTPKMNNTLSSFWCLGISYGCVHAIACAAHLPATCNQVCSGLCLLGPHGPFDDPSGFNPLQGMALPSRIGLGSLGFYWPWLTRFTGRMVQQSVSTPDKARHFVQVNLLDAMNAAEKEQFAAAADDLRQMIASGQCLHDALCESIQGYVDIPSVLRSWSVNDLKHKVTCPTHIFVALRRCANTGTWRSIHLRQLTSLFWCQSEKVDRLARGWSHDTGLSIGCLRASVCNVDGGTRLIIDLKEKHIGKWCRDARPM